AGLADEQNAGPRGCHEVGETENLAHGRTAAHDAGEGCVRGVVTERGGWHEVSVGLGPPCPGAHGQRAWSYDYESGGFLPRAARRAARLSSEKRGSSMIRLSISFSTKLRRSSPSQPCSTSRALMNCS